MCYGFRNAPEYSDGALAYGITEIFSEIKYDSYIELVLVIQKLLKCILLDIKLLFMSKKVDIKTCFYIYDI